MDLEKKTFFTHDRAFYRSLFHILVMVALQNIINFSVNMADNVMLGGYNQASLSGAACVNQIFFIVQQFTIGIGEGFAVIASQYWGQKRTGPICRIAGVALKLSLVVNLLIFVVLALFPHQVLAIFTNDPEIIAQGVIYLSIIKYTFLLYFFSALFMAILRSIEIVRIAFILSIISLVVNVGINYVLIYGRFGFPELGIKGAAIGTLIARIFEFTILLLFVAFKDKKLQLFKSDFLKQDKGLRRDYYKVAVPVILSQVLWAVSVPMQTAILGHLSSDAIAANSVASTFYQYLKVIVMALASASTVVIGMTVGKGKLEEVKAAARTLEVIDVALGLVLATALFFLRAPLLTLYNLTPEAMVLANRLIIVMCFIMVGMSYQMPVSLGTLRGGGDTKFAMNMNMICTWAIVMPLSFMSAFWWKWPVVAVVIVIQSDQIFKALPSFIRIRHYDKWIKKLTKDNT